MPGKCGMDCLHLALGFGEVYDQQQHLGNRLQRATRCLPG